MRLLIAVVAAVLGLVGCGPMMGPLTVPLKPEEQAQVDSAWENMLTPVDRV